MNSDKPKKPKGWRSFDALARTIARVPKEEVEKRVEQARENHPRSKPKPKK